jgi:DNA polymerase III delta' subunit
VFDEVLGQERVKTLFERAVRDDELSHAYLLAGPEGLAKTAFARELAVAMVCSCGGCACAECERARRGAHPDLQVIEREGELIRFEQVEPLVTELSLRPFVAGRRVWVIPEIEYLHPAAAARLLKSIEEPPAYAYFLLVTDRPDRVLPTIVSRCQVVEFRPLRDEQIAGYLREQYGIDGPAGEAVTRLAGGSVERAARLAEDARTDHRRAKYLDDVARRLTPAGPRTPAKGGQDFFDVLSAHLDTIKTDVAERLAQREAEIERRFGETKDADWQIKRVRALARREEARLRRLAAVDALETVASWVRDLWVVACGASDVLWNSDRSQALLENGAVATPEHYARLLAGVSRTRKDLYLNIDQKLALQALFASFEEVVERA